MDLVMFNALSSSEAQAELMACCASERWAARVAGERPFATVGELIGFAERVLIELDESGLEAALAGHPRIGEFSAHPSSRREQAGLASAGAGPRAELARANRDYEARFGHVYLVCADGRSGEELLALLRERLAHDPATERRVARDELAKINRLRLARLVRE